MASRKRPASSSQDYLFSEEVSLLLPVRLAIAGRVLGSLVRQIAAPALRETCRLRPFSMRRVNGYEATLKSGETLKIISARRATLLKREKLRLDKGQNSRFEHGTRRPSRSSGRVGRTIATSSTSGSSSRVFPAQ